MNEHQALIDQYGLVEALRRIRLTHNMEVSRIDLRFAIIHAQTIDQLDLSGVNLAHSVWKKVSIKCLTGSDIRLEHATWEEVEIFSGDITFMVANGIKFSHCHLSSLHIALSEIARSLWEHSILNSCRIQTTKLVNTTWKKCTFIDTSFDAIDGRYLDIRPDAIGLGNIFTGKTVWINSDLRRAKFRLDDLKNIQIVNMILSRPTLKEDGRFTYSQYIGNISSRPQRKPQKRRRRL